MALIISLCILGIVLYKGEANYDYEIIYLDSYNDTGEFIGIRNWYWDIDDDTYGILSEKILINEQTALEIGNAIMKSIFDPDIIQKTYFTVYEVEGEDFLVVSRTPRKKGGEIKSYNVAISKFGGAILRIWIEE